MLGKFEDIFRNALILFKLYSQVGIKAAVKRGP